MEVAGSVSVYKPCTGEDSLCCKLCPDIQLCLFSVIINIIRETYPLFFYKSLIYIYICKLMLYVCKR